MTLDEQIKWLADEAAKRLAAAGRRDQSAKHHSDKSQTSGYNQGWHSRAAARKDREGQRLREEAATMLAIENSVRQLKAAQEVA